MVGYRAFFIVRWQLFCRIVSFLLFCMFSSMVYGATGVVSFTSPLGGQTFYTQSNFTVKGTFLMTEDNTPTGVRSDAACVSPYNPTGRAKFGPSFWDTIWWQGTHAEIWYSIDGQGVGRYPIGGVGFTRGINGRSYLGVTQNFSAAVNVSGMKAGTSHTVTAYMVDIYSKSCGYGSWRWSNSGMYRGSTFASATLNFTIKSPKPTISMNLAKPSVTACEAETGSITVTSNDPTPNGGTVTLSFPNGTTASAVFAGKSANLTFADFALPNGYSGAHKVGDVLTFTASVTTAAGYTASSQTTATVTSGGLTVTMTPNTATVEPKLQTRTNVELAQLLSARTQNIQISVVGPLGPVQGGVGTIRGAQVKATLEMLPSAETFGGHDHGATGRPLSTLGTLSAVKEVNGIYQTTYSSSIYASKAQIRVTATVPNSQCTGEIVSGPFIAQVSGLKPILSNLLVGNGRLVGGTCNHHGPSDTGTAQNCQASDNNHYLRQISLDKLLKLQQAWEKAYVNNPKYNYGSLRINDASLPKGGKFEVSTMWGPSWVSHKTHRRGVDVDIGVRDTANMNSVTKKKLIKLNDRAGSTLFRNAKDETDKFHLHVYLE